MFYALTLVLCVSVRFLAHPYNLTPVGASSIFAGRTLPLPWAIALTWIGMFLGNLGLSYLRGYPVMDATSPFVFGAFALQVVLGRLLRDVRGGALMAAFSGGLLFFVISNLGVFLASGLYPHTREGLLLCYAAALPFLRNMLAGDLIWTVALMPVYRWASSLRMGRGSTNVAVTRTQLA
jgi:hypothetical protein